MDDSNTHGSAGCPENVAYKLLLKIAAAEGYVFTPKPDAHHRTADRDWILATYAECLNTVRGFKRRRDTSAASVLPSAAA